MRLKNHQYLSVESSYHSNNTIKYNPKLHHTIHIGHTSEPIRQ